MEYISCKINEIGLAEIHEFLGKYHKRGKDWFTPDMLRAWAKEAELEVCKGNSPTIELRLMSCVLDKAVLFTLSNDGVDVDLLDDGEED